MNMDGQGIYLLCEAGYWIWRQPVTPFHYQTRTYSKYQFKLNCILKFVCL